MEPMNMKSMITAFVLVLFVAISVASAAFVPLPISGRISNEGNLEGIQVTITDLNTGETITTFTNSFGEYLFDWSNSVQKWTAGDTFSISVGSIVQTVKATGAPIEADFDLHGIVCPTCQKCECGSCPAPPVCQEVICPACSEKHCPSITCPDTPACPITPACPEPEECPVCPQPDPFWSAVLPLLSAIVGALAGGAGIKFVLRKDKSGKTTLQVTQHKHDGSPDYHSIYTMHKNYTHPSGVINPQYDKYGKFIGGK